MPASGAVAETTSGSVAETIRGAYVRDWLGVGDAALEGALLELLDPDVVFLPEPNSSSPTTPHVGVGEVARLFRQARDDWSSCRYLLDHVQEPASGEVLVSGWVIADSRPSGARVSFPFAHVWSARGERVVRVAAYHDRREASEALTLRDAA